MMTKKKPLWFRFTDGGIGSRSAHAHLKTDNTGEIEFQCGLQRHMDDTILSSKNKCPRCVDYLKNQRSAPSRALLSGRRVQEMGKSVPVIESKCPEKWVCVDLETGDTWVRENGKHITGNYRRPKAQEVREAVKILKNPR